MLPVAPPPWLPVAPRLKPHTWNTVPEVWPGSCHFCPVPFFPHQLSRTAPSGQGLRWLLSMAGTLPPPTATVLTVAHAHSQFLEPPCHMPSAAVPAPLAAPIIMAVKQLIVLFVVWCPCSPWTESAMTSAPVCVSRCSPSA